MDSGDGDDDGIALGKRKREEIRLEALPRLFLLCCVIVSLALASDERPPS
jgi:hypothetical protein